MTLQVSIQKNVKSFSLNVEFETSGGCTGILGASGCGKSMTLKCIAGIEKPDKGRIVLNGRVLFDSDKGQPAAAAEKSWILVSGLCIVSQYDGSKKSSGSIKTSKER